MGYNLLPIFSLTANILISTYITTTVTIISILIIAMIIIILWLQVKKKGNHQSQETEAYVLLIKVFRIPMFLWCFRPLLYQLRQDCYVPQNLKIIKCMAHRLPFMVHIWMPCSLFKCDSSTHVSQRLDSTWLTLKEVEMCWDQLISTLKLCYFYLYSVWNFLKMHFFPLENMTKIILFFFFKLHILFQILVASC